MKKVGSYRRWRYNVEFRLKPCKVSDNKMRIHHFKRSKKTGFMEEGIMKLKTFWISLWMRQLSGDQAKTFVAENRMQEFSENSIKRVTKEIAKKMWLSKRNYKLQFLSVNYTTAWGNFLWIYNFIFEETIAIIIIQLRDYTIKPQIICEINLRTKRFQLPFLMSHAHMSLN